MTDRLLDQIQAGLTARDRIDWQQIKAAMDAPLREAMERTQTALQAQEARSREALNQMCPPPDLSFLTRRHR